jgi:hypothetical protein
MRGGRHIILIDKSKKGGILTLVVNKRLESLGPGGLDI